MSQILRTQKVDEKTNLKLKFPNRVPASCFTRNRKKWWIWNFDKKCLFGKVGI